MRWDLPQPRDARLLHLHVGIEALGDGVTDERGAALLQPVEQLLESARQCVEFGGLPVEEGGYGFCLFFRGKGAKKFTKVGEGDVFSLSDSCCGSVQSDYIWIGFEEMSIVGNR